MTGRFAAGNLLVGSGCLWLLLGACSGDDATPPGTAGPDTMVYSIQVNPHERTIGILGGGFGIGAEALAEDGEVLYGSTLHPGRFSWSSSAPDVASVDQRLVTGVSVGTAIITATSEGVTGRMTVSVQDRAHLEWSIQTATGVIGAGVAVGADGTIYVGTDDSSADRSVWYALSPQGSVLWTLALPLTWRPNPAIGADGTLYLGSMSTSDSDGSLIAVDPAGIIRWVLPDLEEIRSSAALGPDGMIYLAGGRYVYAVDPQGELRWTYAAAGPVFVYSSPAVASDGTIYVGGDDSRLHAINPDGTARWMFETGGLIQSSPAIGPDGTIYVGSEDGRLYAVQPDGSERWSLELDRGGVASSPSIGADGTIYVMAGSLFAIDPGGSIRWSYPAGSHGSQPTPILGADGTVYFGSFRGVTALDAHGSLLWDYGLAGSMFGSPTIGVDGKIIAGSFIGSDGTVIAIEEHVSTNGGYSGAAWPQERGDRANTGRVGG